MSEAASAETRPRFTAVQDEVPPRKEVRPLFFQRIEALDSNRHRGLRRRQRTSYGFASGTNAVPLGYSEVPRASQDYPVVFAGDGEALHLVALVGLTADTNLYVNADGRWLGRYIPAYLRAYPFAFARAAGQAPGTYTVAIDPDSAELGGNPDGGGVPLFTEAGEQTSHLTQVIEFLRYYDAQTELALTFAKRVSELGLLRAVSADVRLKNGQQHVLTGLRVVERSALRALPVAARMELYDAEWLEPIYHQLASLQTFSQLVDRLALGGGAAGELTRV